MAESVPFIDLEGLRLHGSYGSEALRKQLAQSCRGYGFFQIKNHGVDPEMLLEETVHEYFQLPENTGMLTSFDVKEKNWRDYLKLHCHPIEEYIQQWPANPPCVREYVAEYCRKMKVLCSILHDAILESSGLHDDDIDITQKNHGQQLAINYYSNCPHPELIQELLGNADTKVIFVQLKDEVPSLQLLEDGKWVVSNPIANTFTFNIGDGDQMQILIAHDFKLSYTNVCKPR